VRWDTSVSEGFTRYKVMNLYRRLIFRKDREPAALVGKKEGRHRHDALLDLLRFLSCV